MKNFLYCIIAFMVLLPFLLIQGPISAAGLGISPSSVEFDVPANGSTEVEFRITNFSGNLEISLEDIPLEVKPTSVPVSASSEGTKITLTFYGDESTGSKIYNGKIRFLAMTGGAVALGLKVKATINQVPAGPQQQAQAQTASQGETGNMSSNKKIILIIIVFIILMIVLILITIIRRRLAH